MTQQWQQALGLLAAMREAELLPNVITYSAAICACEKAQLAAGSRTSGGDAGG